MSSSSSHLISRRYSEFSAAELKREMVSLKSKGDELRSSLSQCKANVTSKVDMMRQKLAAIPGSNVSIESLRARKVALRTKLREERSRVQQIGQRALENISLELSEYTAAEVLSASFLKNKIAEFNELKMIKEKLNELEIIETEIDNERKKIEQLNAQLNDNLMADRECSAFITKHQAVKLLEEIDLITASSDDEEDIALTAVSQPPLTTKLESTAVQVSAPVELMVGQPILPLSLPMPQVPRNKRPISDVSTNPIVNQANNKQPSKMLEGKDAKSVLKANFGMINRRIRERDNAGLRQAVDRFSLNVAKIQEGYLSHRVINIFCKRLEEIQIKLVNQIGVDEIRVELATRKADLKRLLSFSESNNEDSFHSDTEEEKDQIITQAPVSSSSSSNPPTSTDVSRRNDNPFKQAYGNFVFVRSDFENGKFFRVNEGIKKYCESAEKIDISHLSSSQRNSFDEQLTMLLKLLKNAELKNMHLRFAESINIIGALQAKVNKSTSAIPAPVSSAKSKRQKIGSSSTKAKHDNKPKNPNEEIFSLKSINGRATALAKQIRCCGTRREKNDYPKRYKKLEAAVNNTLQVLSTLQNKDFGIDIIMSVKNFLARCNELYAVSLEWKDVVEGLEKSNKLKALAITLTQSLLNLINSPLYISQSSSLPAYKNAANQLLVKLKGSLAIPVEKVAIASSSSARIQPLPLIPSNYGMHAQLLLPSPQARPAGSPSQPNNVNQSFVPATVATGSKDPLIIRRK